MRRLTVPVLMLGLSLGLAACGQRSDLRPKDVAPVPVAYGREQPASVTELTTPPAQAAPERNVELRTRSEPREDDPFNLPPKE